MTIDSSCLLPISRHTIMASLPVAVNVYYWSRGSNGPQVFCGAGNLPDRWRTRDVDARADAGLYVANDDRAAYQQYLRENWRELVGSSGKQPFERVGIMGDIAREVLHDAFRTGQSDTIIRSSRELAGCICDVLEENTTTVCNLHTVLHHDYELFTNSTNVSIYCVILARALGIAPGDLRNIAMGGLLHDLGKLELDEKLLHVAGQLTQSQYREIMQHPIYGFRMLVNRSDLTFGQLMMVYQHHERLDGSGYPTAVTNEEIHDWAKICAIAEAYESLTTFRTYRPAATPEQAIRQLSIADGALDDAMLDCWRKLVCQPA